jgi:hypothetical protein
MPFHRSIKIPPVPVVPTAQALRAETAATPSRPPPAEAAGLRACCQDLPFQPSIKVLDALPQLRVQPTAQVRPAEMTATEFRMPPAGLGLRTRFQAVPFQRRITVPELRSPSAWPTAQALRGDQAATPSREPPTVRDAAGPAKLTCAAATPEASPVVAPARSTETAASLAERLTGIAIGLNCYPLCANLVIKPTAG